MKTIANGWKSIKCSLDDLNIDIVLACGQSFRWKKNSSNEWRSVLKNRVWSLKQTDDELLFKIHDNEENEYPSSGTASRTGRSSIPRKRLKKSENDISRSEIIEEELENGCHEEILRDYFQLDVDLIKLYENWKNADPNFEKISKTFKGIRMLRQDPTENLISFICSSNNNISRISGMVDKLCKNFGCKILDLDGEVFHSFPDINTLADKSVEGKLRQLGFGYRARYIQQTAEFISKECPPYWLDNLRNVPYEEAHNNLKKLSGVGAKVADCVCLMSLDKHQAIPVDTHVWQIACRDYLPSLKKQKSLTDSTYKAIGDHFRMLYGDYAGWAHSVLFSADLKKFKQ